jgi:SNF2 family DNA or RNA helicase
MLSNEIKEKLLEYQIKHCESLITSLNNHNRCLDASDTGTGKTYTAIAAAKHLDLKPLIICPKSVINSWRAVLRHFGYEDNYYGIGNYELIKNCRYYDKTLEKVSCPYINTKTEIVKSKKGKQKKIKTYTWEIPNDCLLLIDEAHSCKNLRTMNSQLLISLAKKNTTKVMIISATICDKPENFRNFGYLMGFYDNLRKGQYWINKVGLNFSNKMLGVRKYLYPDYASRMCIKSLGDLFPANQVEAKAYDMDNAPEIQKMYDLIKEAEEDLKDKEKKAIGIAKLMRARQRIENLKTPTMIEIAKGFIEEGNAVAIFVNFTQTLRTIGEALNTTNFIFGEQTLEERDANIKKFQDDKEHIVIANIKAGGLGISLHDTHGNYPRVSIVSPSWSAQDTLQAIGRVFRAKTKTAVRQRIVYCNNTIESSICELMKDKINNIALLNDGDNKGYKIKGLIDDNVGNQEEELSEAKRLQLKIETLILREIRLKKELKEVTNELQSLDFISKVYMQELQC